MTNLEVPAYRYQVVTSQGIGIHSREIATEEEAQALAGSLSDRNHKMYADAEVERIEKVGRGRRYWLKRGGEWRFSHDVRAGLTRDQILAREAEEATKPRRTGPRTWIGTFTRKHFHPNTGQSLAYTRVQFQAASRDDANDVMWETFGDEGWYDVHDIEDVRDELGPPYVHVPWPTPPVPPGETVTLRVRLTDAHAQESHLWIAERSILRRPTADHAVLCGVGVAPEGGAAPLAWFQRGDARVGGAGVVLLVRFVRRADAERAARLDPENVSIVEGSVSFGTFRRPPKIFKDEPVPSKNTVVVNGVFTLEALEAIASAEPSFTPIYDEAFASFERTGADKDVFGIEIENNHIVAVYVVPKDPR